MQIPEELSSSLISWWRPPLHLLPDALSLGNHFSGITARGNGGSELQSHQSKHCGFKEMIIWETKLKASFFANLLTSLYWSSTTTYDIELDTGLSKTVIKMTMDY